MSDNLIERPVIPLPDGFTWGFVTARSIHAMADTTQDFDRYPEARGSNGRVIFTPRVRFNKHTEDPTAFVQYEIARARIREGTMIDAEGQEGIWLITGDYDVTFQIDDGSIPGFPITVTEEYTPSTPLDLVKYSPIETPPGYVEIVRIVDRERAESAAEEAEGHAETASGYVDEARQIVQTETFEGFVSDAQSARDQADQHRASAQESANSASQDANRSEMAYAGVEDLLEDLPDSFEDVATRDYVDTSVSGLASESYVEDYALTATGHNLSSGTDLNDFLGNQIGYVASSIVDSIENKPPTAPSSGAMVLVYTNRNSGIHTQEWIVGIGSYRNRRYIRTRTASQTNWSDWDESAYMSDLDGLASESYVDDRITEVNAIKGSIPDGTDVDDAYGEAWHGCWYVASSHGVIGLPKDPVQGSVFEVQWTSGANGTTQFYTDRFDRYWREASLSGSGNSVVTGWGPWYRIASTEEVENAVSGLASESYVDTSVSGLASEDSVQSRIDSLASSTLQYRQSLPDGTDLEEILSDRSTDWGGHWRLDTNNNTYYNLPEDFDYQATPGRYSGLLFFRSNFPGASFMMVYDNSTVTGGLWWRNAVSNTASGLWHKVVDQDSVIVATSSYLSEGDDLDDFLGNQLSYVNSENSPGIVNRPPDAPSDGATVVVYTGGGSDTQNQEWTLNTGDSRGHKWVRSRAANRSSWGSWHKLVFEEDLDDLASEISALRSALESLENESYRHRGQIPSGTDMNDMYGSEWRGIWWSSDSSDLSNTPLDFSGATVIEILSTDRANACKQVVTTNSSSYWREAALMSGGSVSSWGDWHDYTG